MSADWRVEITPPARRDLRRTDPPVRDRVLAALERLADDPRGAELVRLRGRPEWRLRVDDWRVRLRLDHQARAVVVLRVLPRGRAYRD